MIGKTLGWILWIVVLLSPVLAHAATGGGGLPWETPLQTLSNSISGPVAYGLSIVGLVASGGVLILIGGELNHFVRTVVQVVMVIAFIIAGKNTMAAFGWGSGAEIGHAKELRGKEVIYAADASEDPQSRR